MSTASSLPGTFYQEKNTLIVSDSLGRDLCHIYKADIISRPGCNIQALQRTLNQINLAKYSGLIIIIGTNDLSDKTVWSQYLKHKKDPHYKVGKHPTTDIGTLRLRYSGLIDAIRRRNPTIIIELNPIIPRPFEYEVNLSYLKSVNNMIK